MVRLSLCRQSSRCVTVMALSSCAQRQEIGHQITYLVWQAQIGPPSPEGSLELQLVFSGVHAWEGLCLVALFCYLMVLTLCRVDIRLEDGSKTVVLPNFAVEVRLLHIYENFFDHDDSSLEHWQG